MTDAMANARAAIVRDLCQTAAARSVRCAIDMAQLCNDPNERFAVMAAVLVAVAGATTAAYEQARGLPKGNSPGKEIVLKVIEAVFEGAV